MPRVLLLLAIGCAGADAMARMRDGSTAFDWAVFGGHRPTMELVADHPSVDLTALNRFGCAAVQWAAAAAEGEGGADAISMGQLLEAMRVLGAAPPGRRDAVSYTHLRAHET